jgi:16S rRNA processing protein RimM
MAFRVGSCSPAGALRDGRSRVRLWLQGIETREQAELWLGARLAIPEDALETLSDGEYYWRDILGLRCRTVAGKMLGTVEEIWPAGENDILVVREGGQTTLIPALRQILARVDFDSREIWIEPPAGLLEEEA